MAESLSGTQLQQFRKMFGTIDGVSDREYFTNSFHIPVWADITPMQKQDMEVELFHKFKGGHIQYCRIDNPENMNAIKAIVERAMNLGLYFGVNVILTICDECGYRSPTDDIEVCPICGCNEITMMGRICGYIGLYKRMADHKRKEISERISM